MHHFFVKPEEIGENNIFLTGDNYNHAKNVLRVKSGEQLLISDGSGTDYVCEVKEVGENEDMQPCLELGIRFREQSHELDAKIYLFQGLPKSDKMELIIQKAVELGVTEIVPVRTKHAVVKLDDKKAAAKVARWQGIAEAAAKQSKRGMVPGVARVMDFQEALVMAKGLDFKLIPYENAENIQQTMEQLKQLQPRASVGIFIGPEGGFAPEEIEAAEAADILPVTLGRRILRTETAAICALSIVMLTLESRMARG